MDEAVAVTGLGRRFGAQAAVADVGLTVGAGRSHALVGANGAGKTTTLRLLAGLLAPTSGGGRVLGFDLAGQAREVARSVGYMSQRLALHADLTVAETLRFRAAVHGIPRAADRAEAAMESYALTPFRRVLAGRLSGGWARRLQLCAALIHAPRLLLLDEPAAGLDEAAAEAIWGDIAARVAEGAAVVVNTHDPAEARRCDGVSAMAQGRIVATGSAQDVLAAARAS